MPADRRMRVSRAVVVAVLAAACNAGPPTVGVPGAPGAPAMPGAPGYPMPAAPPAGAWPGVPTAPVPPAVPQVPAFAVPTMPTAPTVPAAPVPTTPGAPASFGVPECDQYAAVACGCQNETIRASVCASVTMSFQTWSGAVAMSPVARPMIGMACAQAAAAIAPQCGGSVAGAPGAAVPAWDGQSTFDCGGNLSTRLSGMNVTLTASPAIRAGGNCQLELADMNITAPVVLSVGGNAHVTITGGSLTGTEHAIEAGGNAQVGITGTTVTGSVERRGNAQVTGP